MNKITKDQLLSLNACEEAVDLFDRFFPNGFDMSKWSLEYQIKILTKTRLRKYLGWCFDNKLLPQWSMCGADLNGANLRYANLTDANLIGADLRGADLNGAIGVLIKKD